MDYRIYSLIIIQKVNILLIKFWNKKLDLPLK